MKHCVNCGAPYEKPSGVCPSCCSDERVPDEFIDLAPARGAHASWDGPPHFGYPGERAALLLAVSVSVVVAVLLGAISFGLFILLIVLNLAYLALDFFRNPRTMTGASETSFRKVHRLARLAAHRLGIPLPPVYVDGAREYNAYTRGFGRYGFVVLHSSLVEDFRPMELLFVLGHEMGHMKRYHTTWLSLTHPARVGGARFILAPVMDVIFNVWSVKSEYTADQAGLIACRDPHAAVTTMLKLAGGPSLEKETDVSRILEVRGFESELTSELLEYLGTHPFHQNRMRQLAAFSSSRMYAEALRLSTGSAGHFGSR